MIYERGQHDHQEKEMPDLRRQGLHGLQLHRGEAEMTAFVFDYPFRELSPNYHAHWSKKEHARKAAILIGKNAAQHHPPLDADGEYRITISVYPPDKRRRDLDNIIASMKPYIDGLCFGLGIDDSTIKDVSAELGEVIKGGAVIVDIDAIGVI